MLGMMTRTTIDPTLPIEQHPEMRDLLQRLQTAGAAREAASRALGAIQNLTDSARAIHLSRDIDPREVLRARRAKAAAEDAFFECEERCHALNTERETLAKRIVAEMIAARHAEHVDLFLTTVSVMRQAADAMQSLRDFEAETESLIHEELKCRAAIYNGPITHEKVNEWAAIAQRELV